MKLILTTMVALLTLSAVAQHGTLKGKIVTTDGKPAAYVNVQLHTTKLAAISDEFGTYELKNIPAGSYQFTVSQIGLQTISKSVVIAANETLQIDITLVENAVKLAEVIVQSRRNVNATPVNIGRVAINPLDLPQSITVIGKNVLQDQQVQRLSDVLKNVNGVYLASTRGATQENFSARGYSFSSTNMFKDGVRINSGTMPETSSLEKVEILKGSAAILYGNVSPGGILNMVTKQPKFQQGGDVSCRTGSFDLYRPTIDRYGPINSKIAYRVNGVYENAGSYRNIPNSKRYFVNPSLLFKPSNRTELLLQADYLSHAFTPDFGIGTYDNTKIPNVGRSAFFGTAWQYAKTQQISTTATLKHQLSNTWQLNTSLSYQQYDRDYYATERIQAAANGDWVRPLSKTKNHEEYYIAQVSANGKLTIAGMQHTVLVGADADRYLTKATSYTNPTTYDTINIFDPKKYTARTDIPIANALRMITTPVIRFGAYVQDLISITSKLKLLAGVRFSAQDARPIDTVTFATGVRKYAVTNKVDKAFSPRVGLVYKITNLSSAFVSYANSFAINAGTDVFGNALAPSIIDQYEIGVKNNFFGGALSANVTAYRIVNNNLAQTALFSADGITPNNNANLKALTGQTTSDGVEIDLGVHALKGLDVLAGYSYNFMRYTRTPNTIGSFIEGERLINNPASTANGSVFYTFSEGAVKGLKLGAAAFFTGIRFAGFNNTKGQTQTYARNFEVSGFTTVDLSAGYSFKKYAIMTKVSNLTNTFNYYVHENYSVNPIAPTQFVATLLYKF
ncbi:TonB-dependent siderophore receptor [Parasediminibacterium paludis]|uniref:TonB-dependent siderophore receptor n=1 Tax=Parasediminibacterium paludis TaxID=908966 RepID=A0ABV8PWV3_9BACT